MKVKKIYTAHFPMKGYKALTVWPFVFVRKEFADRFTAMDERHEMIHALQQVELLILPFLFIYCLEWLLKLPLCRFDGKRAYQSISFEQEAYGHQSEVCYNNIRRHYAWRHAIFTLIPKEK